MKRKIRKHKVTPIEKLAEKAMKAAARDVIIENKRFGEPLIVWEDGKIKKIPADQIVVD